MKIKCKKCGDIIESKSVHDLVQCSCKSIFIDGGDYYTRIGWPEGDPNLYYEQVIESRENVSL